MPTSVKTSWLMRRQLHVDHDTGGGRGWSHSPAAQQPERDDLAADPGDRKQAVDGLADPDLGAAWQQDWDVSLRYQRLPVPRVGQHRQHVHGGCKDKSGTRGVKQREHRTGVFRAIPAPVPGSARAGATARPRSLVMRCELTDRLSEACPDASVVTCWRMCEPRSLLSNGYSKPSRPTLNWKPRQSTRVEKKLATKMAKAKQVPRRQQPEDRSKPGRGARSS